MSIVYHLERMSQKCRIWKNYFIAIDREYKEEMWQFFARNFLEKNVVSAVLLFYGTGVYEAELNGKKAGEQMFAPWLYLLSAWVLLSGA